MGVEVLSGPFEAVDAWMAGLLAGAPILVAAAIALVMGLRHASDPDHLVAVTSLVVRDDGGVGRAARIGTWWGVGHAATLVAIGVPLVVLRASMPATLELVAEAAVGVLIVALSARVLWRWGRGDFRSGPGRGGRSEGAHGHRLSAGPATARPLGRSRGQAFLVGVLHGLAGTGAVVVLLIAALPGREEAAVALLVFAPMSIVSMASLTVAFSWCLTRRPIRRFYGDMVIPLLGAFGLLFGSAYIGLF